MAKTDITAARVLDLLDYNYETGAFTWRPKPAGHKHQSGYVHLRIDGQAVSAHHLAWLIAYGSWPLGVIDHINGDRSDNRIENLRDTTSKVNAQNQRKAKASSQSKLLGVVWNKGRSKWQAELSTGEGKRKYLGIFDTPEEAHAVYLEAKRRLHEGCTI